MGSGPAQRTAGGPKDSHCDENEKRNLRKGCYPFPWELLFHLPSHHGYLSKLCCCCALALPVPGHESWWAGPQASPALAPMVITAAADDQDPWLSSPLPQHQPSLPQTLVPSPECHGHPQLGCCPPPPCVPHPTLQVTPRPSPGLALFSGGTQQEVLESSTPQRHLFGSYKITPSRLYLRI